MFEDSGEIYNQIFLEEIKYALDSLQCPGFENNERRIKFILKMIHPMGMKNLVSSVTDVEKNSNLSREFRVKGNGFFTNGSKLDKAIEEYTKSVAYAPTGSQELALAYANRSAVLFKARLISDCLLDIERALKNNYPDNLKAKLYLRKAMCLQILKSKNDPSIKAAFAEARKWAKKMDKEKQKIMEEMLTKQEKVTSIDKSTFSKWDYKKFLPKLPSKNLMIPGLSDAVESQYSEKYGRHVVATRDIEPGEVIAVQKPYSSLVRMDSRYTLCWYCCEQTWASIPCEKCVHVVFCSGNCREKAMLEHHEIECPVISSLLALNWSHVVFMPLRLAVKALKEMDNSFGTWRRNIEKTDAEKNPLLKGFTNNVLEPNKFSSVYCLSAHVEIRYEITERVVRSSIILAFLLATKTSYFGSKLDDDLGTLSSMKDFIFVIGLLEKLIKISQCNNLGTDMEDKGRRLIVPAVSIFNHSCSPMVTRNDYNDYMTSRTLRPIKKGQQIFDSYGPNYKMMPKNQRQAHLLLGYNFLCKCEACENNWLHGDAELPMQRGMYISPLTMEASFLFHELSKKVMAMKLQNNVNFNIEKDVARVATALKKFYRLGLQPNSFEISTSTLILWELFDLTKNRFLSLD